VVVEDGATISYSLVCSQAKILKKAVLEKGCIVSFRAVVGTNTTLKACSKITTVQMKDELFEEISLGPNGIGHRWLEEENPRNQLVVDEQPEDDTDTNSEFDPFQDLDTDTEEDHEITEIIDTEETRWVSEVAATVKRALEENHALENLKLELKTLKFTFEHRTFSDLALMVLPTLLDMAQPNDKGDILPNLVQLVRKWGPVMEGYLASLDEQVGLIHALQKYYEEHPKVEHAFQYVLHALYDIEIIEEDAIWRWKEHQQKVEGPESRFLQQCSMFLWGLEQA